jgi:predicted secreted protein
MTMRTLPALLIVAAFAGCASAPADTAPQPSAAPAPAPVAAAPATPGTTTRREIVTPNYVTLDEQDALIELKRGARVHVRLETERVSKRRWNITTLSGSAVAPYGNPWFTAKNIRALHEPGNWIFDFDAVAPGTASVTFDYRRDGEPLSAAERKVTFDFIVR